MRKILVACALIFSMLAQAQTSPTEGVITADFVGEEQMQDDIMQMLADFSKYMKADFQQAAAPNSVGEECGCFRGENTMGSDERGVRPNADLGMICAFLAKYGKGKVTLPTGVTWDDIETMAMKSFVFAYSTHKANRLKVCAGGSYWGSTSTSDAVWESSLWAMSVAYSAFFLWDRLSDAQKGYVYQMLKAECNYELGRSIPIGYSGDTKAEENGWEADILAATLGLFPDDALAPRWFQRLREFAVNSYSHPDDKNDQTIVDPDYDTKTVAQLYRGQNLFADYTLQNHGYFHTSYQNVVMQELGEAALALKLFQTGLYGEERWKTNALMHHNREVQREVLNWLALTDGELAMPNGNDWSLFLYDQITSYSTNACFLRDQDALMLENLAYKYIKARQQTTGDGSWLLRPDVGARRMGVEGHRVMMTWLMHHVASTADLVATDFEAFRQRHAEARTFGTQNIVRAFTKDRFSCFSWSAGLKSYTGYIAANSVDKNKIVVPYRANNTGNFIGWYEVPGKATNAIPVVEGIYELKGEGWTMNGELDTNDGTLNNRFAIYSTPGNAVIYVDNVRAKTQWNAGKEYGGLMAVSTDPLTQRTRTLYYSMRTGDGSVLGKELDGTDFTTFDADWVNIDNHLGVVTTGGRKIAFGDRSENNSVMTSKLYASYSEGMAPRPRGIVWYSGVDAQQTKVLDGLLVDLNGKTTEGWCGVIAFDPDSTGYLLLVNTGSDEPGEVAVRTALGAPVFGVRTEIVGDSDGGHSETKEFVADVNRSVSEVLRFFIGNSEEGHRFLAIADDCDDSAFYIENLSGGVASCRVTAVGKQGVVRKDVSVSGCIRVSVDGKELVITAADFPDRDSSPLEEHLRLGYGDISEQLQNNSFEADESYGARGTNVTAAGITYPQCYVNTVAAINSRWPNVLPVKGWTAGNRLTDGSNYARMYSMPYSIDTYCVSPSGVGNYAAQTTGMMADAERGERTLTVLNSWSRGANAITQNVRLSEGSYRVLMDVKYDCPDQSSCDGRRVVAGGNTNISLTGVRIGSQTDYRYPSQRNAWETLCYDFTLENEQTVILSLGYQTTAAVGAASNTLLYIDNVRLLKKMSSGVGLPVRATPVAYGGKIYGLSGQRQSALRRGVNIMNGRKILNTGE